MHEDKTQVITFAEASSSSAGVFNLLFFLKKKTKQIISHKFKKHIEEFRYKNVPASIII